ncbi:MAG TPA: phytanoyl-CoA dioxygenase family protein [Chitinophagales bacterium]|nr:phytanoyl-CoA dioxygenase family protein [Chitinophagales bacterium]
MNPFHNSIFKDKNFERQYEETGFVVLHNVIPPHTIDLLKKNWQTLRDYNGLGFYSTIWHNNKTHRKEVFELIRSSLQRVLNNLFNNYRVIFGNYVMKMPGNNGALGLHQDWRFTDETKHRAINFWFPLTEITANNGPLCVVRGSHKIPNPQRGKNIPQPFAGISEFIINRFGEALIVQPGDVVAYDVSLLHYSGLNTTTQPRLAVTAILANANAGLVHCFRNSQNDEDTEVFEINVDENYFTDYSLYETPSGFKIANKEKLNVVNYSAEEFKEHYYSNLQPVL